MQHACVRACSTRACARQSLDGAIIPARGLRAQPDGDVDHGWIFVRIEKLIPTTNVVLIKSITF